VTKDGGISWAAATSTSFTFSGLNPDVTHEFAVRAMNAVLNSRDLHDEGEGVALTWRASGRGAWATWTPTARPAPTPLERANPNDLQNLLAQGDVVIVVPGNIGIFTQHSPFVIPEGRTLYVATTLNVQRDAELVIKGTVVVLPGGRINSQGNGSTITIAEGGQLINNGHVENVSGSVIVNHGTITNNARFEVRARTTLRNAGTIDGTNPLTIHRDAIVIDPYVPTPPVIETNADFLEARAPAILRNGLTTAQLHLSANNRATLTLIIDGMELVLATNVNNRNVSGRVELPDGSGILVFDIRGNGSNVREFRIIR